MTLSRSCSCIYYSLAGGVVLFGVEMKIANIFFAEVEVEEVEVVVVVVAATGAEAGLPAERDTSKYIFHLLPIIPSHSPSI